MSLYQWIALFAAQIQQTPWLEWIAVATGVAEVLLARKNNVLLYPAGIISAAIYIYIMASQRLYGESSLSLYYVIISIYGWAYWARRRNEPPLLISHTTKKEWGITALIVVAGWTLFFVVLTKANGSAPAWDAWVSATAWAGTWLLARRKVENWLLLNVSNIFAIPLQVHRHLPLTACLSLFLFIVAVNGYFNWRKIYREQHAAQSA